MLMGKRNEEIDELNKNLKEQTEKGDEAAKTLRDMEKEMNKQRKEWSEKVRDKSFYPLFGVFRGFLGRQASRALIKHSPCLYLYRCL